MGLSHNERVATKIAKLMADWEHDPEQIGAYIGRMSPDFVITKLQVITNSAIMEYNNYEMEKYNEPLF